MEKMKRFMSFSLQPKLPRLRRKRRGGLKAWFLGSYLVFGGPFVWADGTGSEAVATPADKAENSESLTITMPKRTLAPRDSVQSLSGKVRVIRNSSGTPEVFFTDLNESYFIPSGSQHNIILQAFQKSEKTGISVSFTANEKSRRIIEVSSQGAGGGSTGARSPSSGDGLPAEAGNTNRH